MKTYSHGKLLISGEYLILEGAVGLAVPLKWGQSLRVVENQGAEVHWISKDTHGQNWFECKLNLIDFSIEKASDGHRANFVQSLIKSAARLNSDFLSKWKNYKVTTELEFDPAWGLGSSSTLIANVATWAELSPFELYFDTQAGSGYDVAASISDAPLLYQKNDTELSFETFDWDINLCKNILVFYQGSKQNSATEVASWKENSRWEKSDVSQMSSLSEELAECKQIDQAVAILREHQKMMEKILNKKAFDGRFADFEGVLKPLGAWGGDFGLALSSEVDYTTRYLQEKGFEHIFLLSDIML
ncbi:MAG TPA: GYDIA family GHMP kinase [Membranihabitans sp.]|nr:GYDIA family GHMP kinase [Membranihabitans sp.]